MTRDEMIAAAKQAHDKVCKCDPKYLMSCSVMALTILQLSEAE